MDDVTVKSDDLVGAFRRLRGSWKGLWDEVPESRSAQDGVLAELARDVPVVTAAARLSEEAAPFVETAVRIRLDVWRPDRADYPEAIEEAALSLRAGFEMRLRTLRQMESGDEILPDSGRELRHCAARDLFFFGELKRLAGVDADEREVEFHRLLQSYDSRRRLIREDLDVPSAAVEAVEFLLRLGVS